VVRQVYDLALANERDGDKACVFEIR
jgi:hypothetical protein